MQGSQQKSNYEPPRKLSNEFPLIGLEVSPKDFSKLHKYSGGWNLIDHLIMHVYLNHSMCE